MIIAFSATGMTLMGAAADVPASATTPAASPPVATAAIPSAAVLTEDSTASPATSPAISPATTPTPSPPATDPASAFTLTAPTFSPTNAVHLGGAKDAGSSVTVAPLASGGAPLCSIGADSTTDWSCVSALPNGKGIAVRATESTAGDAGQSASVMIDVLGAPTITGSDGLVTSGIVSGYGFPGATVTAYPRTGVAGCSSVVTVEGFWSCSLAVASGSYVVTAGQARADLGGGASSSLSGSLNVVVDKDAPIAPTIVSPTAGGSAANTAVTFSGTGESGGTVDLYLDNQPACEAVVVAGYWSCTVQSIATGQHSALAIQRDRAGNYSAPGRVSSVYFGPPSTSAVPPVKPTTPTHPATPPRSPSATPPATPPPTTATPVPSPPSQAGIAPPFGRHPNDWNSPTSFGATLPTLADSVSSDDWALGLALAIAFVIFIALPLRLLSIVLRGRLRFPRMQLTGRNRPGPRPPDATVASNRWLAGSITLAAAGAIIVILSGIDDQVQYVRLVIAVVAGLAILNLAGVLLVRRLLPHVTVGRLRFLPLLMLATVGAALLSHLAGVDPPFVTGVIIGFGFTGAMSVRTKALASLAQVGTITVLATLAWILHSLIPPASAFFGQLLGETVATIALAGFGSAIILMLPVAELPGRAIIEWSTPVWLGSIVVVGTLGSIVFAGGFFGSSDTSVVGSLVLAGAFAAIVFATWGWFRFVEPTSAAVR